LRGGQKIQPKNIYVAHFSTNLQGALHNTAPLYMHASRVSIVIRKIAARLRNNKKAMIFQYISSPNINTLEHTKILEIKIQVLLLKGIFPDRENLE
jgi:hypothetical protein